MKNIKYSNVLWILAAVLLLGFYTLDLESEKASVFTMPDFSSTTEVPQSNNQNAPTLQDFNDAIVNIADQTNPTVVTVRVTKTVERQNPFSRFFGNPQGEPEQYRRQGLGSGVIVSQDGYILTNNHVVANADEVEVKFYDDTRTTAEVVGTDPQTDIAVLKVDTEDLNVIELGNSEQIRVGEMVLAIGSPLGAELAHSVSMGIVSAKDRHVGILAEQGGYERFIQTDAAINPGNSGGALVNMNGELIGINTAIASRSGGNDGIGFAVPINIAKSVMESIIEHGHVTRGYLGISMGGEVDATMAKALGLDQPYGVIVGSVEEDGPAKEAGLQEDDVIQAIDGEPIRNWGAFRTEIGTSSPGDEVELTINRDGDTRDITVTLGEMPDEMMANQNRPTDRESMDEQLGFSVRNLNSEIARQLQLDPGQEGVVVTEVTRGSNAQQQGLQRGDVIISVDRNPISSVGEFQEAVRSIAEGDDNVVLLQVLRGGNKQYIAFEL
ncbi:Do family serine endopeptidase [Aliifodinibius salicampi]|uniref:Do family serine endopeptidase n=1 Tax=Fodinibius salicampi TaxID=1920655 RepID=A0ABT3Q263_9BACT|nr:Do family serine endopeptidase [Fodinibius salicampi]MCW9714176.1 Do family serine endopeptidase [Fodinibius salicampi]